MRRILFFALVVFSQLSLAQSLADVRLTEFATNATVDLGQHKDQTVVINFFASWCTACIKELPELEALKRAHPEAVFVAINAGEKPVLVKKFLGKNSFSYRVLLDPDKSLATKWGIEELPRTLVFKRGELVYNKNVPPAAL